MPFAVKSRNSAFLKRKFIIQYLLETMQFVGLIFLSSFNIHHIVLKDTAQQSTDSNLQCVAFCTNTVYSIHRNRFFETKAILHARNN